MRKNVGRTAGIIGLLFTACAATSAYLWYSDYEALQANLKFDAQTKMAPLLKTAALRDLERGSCSDDNRYISGQLLDYQGHGFLEINGHYLHSYQGQILTMKLGAMYFGTRDIFGRPTATDAKLAIEGDDAKIGAAYPLSIEASDACRRKLLQRFNPKQELTAY